MLFTNLKAIKIPFSSYTFINLVSSFIKGATINLIYANTSSR